MSTGKHLHIVSFAVPYPVVHGGYFDLYYKIVALHAAGINIHLHCFGNNYQEELNKFCSSVQYYERKKSFSLTVPYIVYSRRSEELKKSLQKDNYPILLEGIHSTSILGDPSFSARKIILRLHNVEYLYYRKLFSSSSSFLKKIYYLYESLLLKKYEKSIAKQTITILAVSRLDKNFYEKEFRARNIEFLPVFNGNIEVDILPETGDFCLYHGNLSVSENEHAAMWLIDEVFKNLNIPLIIAGRNPSRRLSQKIKNASKVTLIANPPALELEDMIMKAQCNVLPSFNSTGVKLKLINALYKGRHCIVNWPAVEGSELANLCKIAGSAKEFSSIICEQFNQPLSSGEILFRKQVLGHLFNSAFNTEKIIQML